MAANNICSVNITWGITHAKHNQYPLKCVRKIWNMQSLSMLDGSVLYKGYGYTEMGTKKQHSGIITCKYSYAHIIYIFIIVII